MGKSRELIRRTTELGRSLGDVPKCLQIPRASIHIIVSKYRLLGRVTTLLSSVTTKATVHSKASFTSPWTVKWCKTSTPSSDWNLHLPTWTSQMPSGEKLYHQTRQRLWTLNVVKTCGLWLKASFVWHPDQPTKLNKLYHVCQEEWTHIQPVLCLRLIGGYHEHVAKKLGDI